MAFNFSSFGKLIATLFDTPANGSDSTQISATSTVQGGGFNLGNAGGASNSFGINLPNHFARRGITQTHGSRMDKHAIGDAAGIYAYVFNDGGISAASDEGITGITAQCIEYPGYFHGHVVSSTGVGDTAPVLGYDSGNAWTTDGGYLLNISKGTTLGNLNGPSVSLTLDINSGTVATFLNKLPVTGITLTLGAWISGTTYNFGALVTFSGSNYFSLIAANIGHQPNISPSQWQLFTNLPPSTAIGIATAAIPNPATTRDNPISTTVTVNLANIGGTFKPFVSGSVVTIAGSNYPEQSILTAVSAVSGTNQQTLTLKLANPNLQAIIFQGGIQGQYLSFDANLSFSGQRSAYFAFGSLLGTDFIYGNQVGGGLTNNLLPNAGCEAATNSGAGSGFHFFPGAEVVANTDQGFACKIEQNGVNWTASDLVECTHFPTGGGTTGLLVHEQYSPSNAGFGYNGLLVALHGTGIGGGNGYGAQIYNNNPSAQYSGSGGPLIAPIGLGLNGVLGNLIYCQRAPDLASEAVVFVQSNNAANGVRVSVINLDWAGGGELSFDVTNGRYHMDKVDSGVFSISGTPGITATIATAKLTVGGTNGSMTFSGGILVSSTPAT